MKKISVLIPCYNEEENVVPISEAVIGTHERAETYRGGQSKGQSRSLETPSACELVHHIANLSFKTKL